MACLTAGIALTVLSLAALSPREILPRNPGSSGRGPRLALLVLNVVLTSMFVEPRQPTAAGVTGIWGVSW